MKIIERFKEWNKARKLRYCQRVFAYLYKRPASGMQEVVTAAGYRVGCNIAMGMLDRLNVQHCVFCPETAPLEKYPMGYVCKSHKSLVNPTPQKEEAHGKEIGIS